MDFWYRLSAIVWLLLGLGSNGLIGKTIESMGEKPIYDTTGYSDKNPLHESYFIPMRILYEDMLLPHGTQKIDISFLKKYAKSLPYSRVPYILDIEAWKVGPNVSDHVANINIDKYITVIKTMKESRPELKFGYFGVLPVMDVIRPRVALRQELDAWHRANLRVKRLAPYVDVVCPSPYTFYNDSYLWKNFARFQLKEARMYNKPVLPFIWPEFMDDTPFKGQFLPASLWKEELEFVYANGDGVCIWGGRNLVTHTARVWDENAPWWLITKSLILNRKIRKDGGKVKTYPLQETNKEGEGYYKPISRSTQ